MESFRQWINAHQPVIAAVLLLICAAAGLKMFYKGKPKGPPVIQEWFYDVESKRLFAHPLVMFPPIKTSNGHEAVRALLFTCSECTEEGRFVGYYEKQSEEALAKLRINPMDVQTQQAGLLISADGVKWEPALSPAGQAITKALEAKCPGSQPKPCRPE